MTVYLINILLLVNIFSSLWAKFNKIAYTNDLKTRAEEAFHKQDYRNAASFYDSLLTHYELQDEKLRLNYAHALFKNGDRKHAGEQYEILTTSENNKIASTALQQLGLLAVSRGKNDKALLYFKQALKIDPVNEKARFNYELLTKLNQQELETEQAKKSSQKDKTPPGKRKAEKETDIKRITEGGAETGQKGEKEKGGNLKGESESGREKKGEGGNNGDSRELQMSNKGNRKEESFKIRLSEIQMSEEKAKFLLEEMRNEEVQYLQQLRKKHYNKNYKGPDW